jgi:hypothetical protein
MKKEATPKYKTLIKIPSMKKEGNPKMQGVHKKTSAQVKNIVQNTSKSNLQLHLKTPNTSSHLSTTAFNRFWVTLGRIAGGTITLISDNAPISLDIPSRKLAVVAGTR